MATSKKQSAPDDGAKVEAQEFRSRDIILAEISKLNSDIKKLQDELKLLPVEQAKYASLAEINKGAREERMKSHKSRVVAPQSASAPIDLAGS